MEHEREVCHFRNLPNEVLLMVSTKRLLKKSTIPGTHNPQIFTQLPPLPLFNCSEVCSRWRQLIREVIYDVPTVLEERRVECEETSCCRLVWVLLWLSWTDLDMYPLHPRLLICCLLAAVSSLPFVLPLPVQLSRRYRYAIVMQN